VKFQNIIQLICTVFAIAILAYALIFTKFIKNKAEHSVGAESIYAELGAINTEGNLLAAQAMQQARDFIQAGQYNNAYEKLRFIVNFYPDVPFAPDARRILGELNMDQLMSPNNMRGKSVYTVQKGDSLSRIASKNRTTVEAIMALNALMNPQRIQPQQELVVMPLTFRILINVKQKRVVVYNQETYVKEYPILDLLYPSKQSRTATSVARTVAYEGASLYNRISPYYRENPKMLTLKHGNLVIRAVKHPDEPDLGKGFFLSSSDMEELNLLVKSGTPVEIQL